MDNFAFPPIQFFVEGCKKYGDIFAFRIGHRRAYFIKHPDYIKDVLVTKQSSFVKEDFLKRGKFILGDGLVTSDPEVHRRQRRLIQPGFHKDRIEAFAATMTDFADQTTADWRDQSEIDIASEMLSLTLRIVAKTLFNADIRNDEKDFGEILGSFLQVFNMLEFPVDAAGSDLASDDLGELRIRIDEIIYRMIDERRASGEDAGDLLSMLIGTTDPEDDGKGMSDHLLRDEMVTLILAGHETTTNALTWTWYLLSQNPESERRFHEELDRVLSGDRMPTIDDLPALEYTRKVFTESMRVYPPVWALGRMAIEDCQIGNRPIAKGSVVLMSQYVTHRDAENFAEPERFDPDRWSDEMREDLHPFAYFPFGGGARRCIGEQFAWTEGILVLAAIARNWRFRRAADRKPEPLFLLTLRPNGPMDMTAERRR